MASAPAARLSVDPSDHWQQVHSHKAADDVSWWQEADSLWLDTIDSLDLQPSTPIVDVGAGSSLLADALVGRGFTSVTAVDISAVALDRIRDRLGDAIKYQAVDVRQFRCEFPVGLWHDRAVFHFLTTPEGREQYRRALHSCLAPDGRAIVATFAPDGPATCSGLPVRRYSPEELAEALGLRLIEGQRRVHSTPWGTDQPFTVALLSR